MVFFLLDALSKNVTFGFETKMGYVEKTLAFHHYSLNYPLGEEGAARCINILELEVTDRGRAGDAGIGG